MLGRLGYVFVNRLPATLSFSPFGLGQSVDLASLPVVLASAHQVLRIVDPRSVPILAELGNGFGGRVGRLIRLRADGEVGMTKAVRPFIVIGQTRERNGQLGAVGDLAQ